MFQTTPVSPDFAGQCCERIELVPSWCAASLAAAWLVAAGAMTLFGVALPLPVRIAICIGAATFLLPAIRVNFLLVGPGSITSIAWNDRGQLLACIGPSRVETPADLASGSFRLGSLGFVLWFNTCDGFHSVFIDCGKQNIRDIRRLARRLNWAPKLGPGKQGPAS